MRRVITRSILNICFAFVSFLFITNSTAAQTEIVDTNNPEWLSYFQNDSIEIDYYYSNCNLASEGMFKEEVYLKFTNLTTQSVTISWDLVLKYGTKCFNCNLDNSEMHHSLTLNPQSSIEGSCNSVSDNALKIFSKYLDLENKLVLTEFEIKNLTTRLF